MTKTLNTLLKKAATLRNKEDGFGLIELLVVVIIIGILAAIAIPIYTQQQAAARDGATQQSLKYLIQAINAGKVKTGKSLVEITGSGCSTCTIGAATDPLTVPKSDPVWTYYYAMLSKISAASGMDVTNLVDGYGRPFSIDENEGENGNCTRDGVSAYTDPWVGRSGTKYGMALPLTTRACT